MFKFDELKKFFIYCFIGSLVADAAVAVFTVLTGDFNEVTWRVFATLGIVVAHSLVSLVFIWDDSRQHTFESLAFFTNTVFALFVFSFITSVFYVWQVVDEETIGNLYQSYFTIGFAALHANLLAKALGQEKHTDMIIYANYVFIAVVLLMIQGVIYNFDTLNEMYFRWLAAAAIVDGTLTILTIIFYKLYLYKHPELAPPPSARPTIMLWPHRGIGIWTVILVIYLVWQVAVLFSLALDW